MAARCIGFVFLSLMGFASLVFAQSEHNLEQQVLVHINQYRQQHGLKPLTLDERISQEARDHSQNMARHRVGFGHSHFQTRIKHLHQSIKDSGAGAENVAYNYKDGADVVRNWLTSPGHKQNIDGNYTHTGIGIARDNHGKLYFTQIFLKRGSGSKYTIHNHSSNIFTSPFVHRRQ